MIRNKKHKPSYEEILNINCNIFYICHIESFTIKIIQISNIEYTIFYNRFKLFFNMCCCIQDYKPFFLVKMSLYYYFSHVLIILFSYETLFQIFGIAWFCLQEK